MVLPASFSTDAQAALDKLFTAHAATHPTLKADWQALLASMPRQVTVQQPLTGAPERFTLDRELLLSAVRGPLYQPSLASALPAASGSPCAIGSRRAARSWCSATAATRNALRRHATSCVRPTLAYGSSAWAAT
jgi:hypothetical protein